jgi:hypothetical protein
MTSTTGGGANPPATVSSLHRPHRHAEILSLALISEIKGDPR